MPDAELQELRAQVDCRAVLEHAGWTLDGPESTRNAMKYRGGPAQIVIVTHDGRGSFDPLNNAKGDVIALAQHVWGGSLGHARKALRPLAGVAPIVESNSGGCICSAAQCTPKLGPRGKALSRLEGLRLLDRQARATRIDYRQSRRGGCDPRRYLRHRLGGAPNGRGGTVWMGDARTGL